MKKIKQILGLVLLLLLFLSSSVQTPAANQTSAANDCIFFASSWKDACGNWHYECPSWVNEGTCHNDCNSQMPNSR